MWVYHNFFLLLGSGFMFPEVDPDPDQAKWYGSDWLKHCINPLCFIKAISPQIKQNQQNHVALNALLIKLFKREKIFRK